MTMLFEPLFELQRDFNRFFSPGAGWGAFVPPADLHVTDEAVILHMDVPGLTVEDLEIELENDVLSVRGERSFPGQTDDTKGWQRVERGFGKFERVLRLPKGLDPDAIEASISNGVLTLHLPKPEPLKPRRIQISTGATTDTHVVEGSETRELDSETPDRADEREMVGAGA